MPVNNKLRPWIMHWTTTMTLLGGLTSGCDSDRVAEVATHAADRQAEQNLVMGESNREVARGSRALVAADAEARDAVIGVHKDLLAERTRLDGAWSELDEERRQIARARRTESLLLPVTQAAGGIVLVALLLGFCWRAVHGARSEERTDGALNELLIQELLAAPSLTPLDTAVAALAGPVLSRLGRDPSLPAVTARSGAGPSLAP